MGNFYLFCLCCLPTLSLQCVLDADKKHHMKSKLCYLCNFPRGPSFPRDLLCYLISLLHEQSIPILTYIRHIQYQLSEN